VKQSDAGSIQQLLESPRRPHLALASALPSASALGLGYQPSERSAEPSQGLASMIFSLPMPPLVLTERAGASLPLLNR
jgi:hypothetical protein